MIKWRANLFVSWIYLKLGLPVDQGAARKIGADPQSESAPIARGLSTQLSYGSFWQRLCENGAKCCECSRIFRVTGHVETKRCGRLSKSSAHEVIRLRIRA